MVKHYNYLKITPKYHEIYTWITWYFLYYGNYMLRSLISILLYLRQYNKRRQERSNSMTEIKTITVAGKGCMNDRMGRRSERKEKRDGRMRAWKERQKEEKRKRSSYGREINEGRGRRAEYGGWGTEEGKNEEWNMLARGEKVKMEGWRRQKRRKMEVKVWKGGKGGEKERNEKGRRKGKLGEWKGYGERSGGRLVHGRDQGSLSKEMRWKWMGEGEGINAREGEQKGGGESKRNR